MQSKPWYKSKLTWLGIFQTLIGILGVVSVFLETGDFSPAAVALLLSGVFTVIARVWFTDTVIQ